MPGVAQGSRGGGVMGLGGSGGEGGGGRGEWVKWKVEGGGRGRGQVEGSGG